MADIRRAQLTVAEIDNRIAEDQGARYRQRLGYYITKVDDAYRGEENKLRRRLGVSGIGGECGRELWLNFRWAGRAMHPGRLLRLFNRGHLEEARFLAMLDIIGCQLWFEDDHGGQYPVTGHGGHYGSVVDSILRGVPDMPDVTMVGEFKTHSNKSFNKLVKNGVREAFAKHYIQVNQYMGYYQLPYALYLAVNKDNDELYGELIPYDRDSHHDYYARAGSIIYSQTPPDRISRSPAWYQCKGCAYYRTCHMSEMPLLNCRTCKHSRPTDTGRWYCNKHDEALTIEKQERGCSQYELIQDIIAKA